MTDAKTDASRDSWPTELRLGKDKKMLTVSFDNGATWQAPRFQATPPKSPMSRGGPPWSHTTMWIALNRPAAWSQLPEMPTTRPKSLSAVAAVTVSPRRGRS